MRHQDQAIKRDTFGMQILDIAVIGAGVAGLSCARQLQQAGYRVALIDKSRGLGGRLATRRLPNGTHADHGVCYLKPKHPAFTQLIQQLTQAGTLRVWAQGFHKLSAEGRVVLAPEAHGANACYVSGTGITALAKALAEGLTVHQGQRAIALHPVPLDFPANPAAPSIGWQVTTEAGHTHIARQLVIALPAPQAIALLETLPHFADFDPDCLAQLRSVRFSRCLAAIATYPPRLQGRAAQLPWQGIHCPDHPTLSWIGLDSSKQHQPTMPVVVVQSNANFGEAQFERAGETDPESIGQALLASAATLTGEEWLATPEILQVHRWGYAFALTPLEVRSLSARTPAPLWFSGDWCGGDRVESAFLSGLATAAAIQATATT